jgi:hypothetical protein
LARRRRAHAEPSLSIAAEKRGVSGSPVANARGDDCRSRRSARRAAAPEIEPRALCR